MRPQPPLVERRRRTIVVDPSMQWRCALTVGGVVACGVVVIALARDLQSGSETVELSAERLARLTMLWNGLFVGYLIAAVVTFVLLLTHKVAGPARVLQEAIDGLCDNEFDRRCHVRRRDYLQDLSRSVARLSGKLRADRLRLRILLDRLESEYSTGSGDQALRRLREFREESAFETATRADATAMVGASVNDD